MQYVSIDQMGDVSSSGRAVYIASNCTIKNSTIRNSEQLAILIGPSVISPVIQNNKFQNNEIAINAYPGACSGISNNQNAKIILNGGSVASNVSWPYPGLNSFYLLTGQVHIQQNYTLSIGAGSLVDFGWQSGDLYVEGTLRAIGTEAAPILLTRQQDTTANVYYGRVYLSATSTNSILNFVRMDKLGTADGNAALVLESASFSIANITVSNALSTGVRCTNVGTSIISGSSFVHNKVGIHVVSGRPIFNRCNIYSNTDFGINNVSTAIVDTVDARNCYWGTPSGPYHPALNAFGTGNKVSDRVKINPYTQQPQNGQIRDIGVSALLTPITDCNHTIADSVRVQIRNYGNVSLSGFPVSYRIGTGPVITELVTDSPLLPGQTKAYTFIQRADLSALTSFTISAFTSLVSDTLRLNDTTRTGIQHLSAIGAPLNLTPFNQVVNVDAVAPFTWGAVDSATSYDLYIWKSTDTEPSQPIASNLAQISYTPTLDYGISYKWKVVARRISCRTESLIQTFTTRSLPDLVVEQINVPATATSETDLIINWKVTNQGAGSTLNQGWTDLVYLCDQPVLNAGYENYFIGSIPNLSALDAGQSYLATNLSFRIPQGALGTYYVIVRSNSYAYLKEVNGANNERVSQPITIALAPPADLQVTNVVVNPLNVFSEDSVSISYTVKNAGDGPTTNPFWYDYISISSHEPMNVSSDAYLFSTQRSQPLTANSEYTVNTKVKLPARISGTYYIHVLTDQYGQVYEYNKEENNSRNSLALNVIQRPTPNLTVSNLLVSTTAVSNNQPITIQWDTKNSGAFQAQPSWVEQVYVSADTTFSIYDDISILALTRSESIPSLGSSTTQQIGILPYNLAEGNYYLFVQTDVGNLVFENENENDNLSAPSAVIHVQNPDLSPVQLTTPANAISEQTITLQWRVKNIGQGSLYDRNWTDRVYLSANSTYEPGIDIVLASSTLNQLLSAGNEYTRQTTATIPVGVSGNYYLLLVSDADNNVLEKHEDNNSQAVPITITLAPWPDLQTTTIAVPATDTVGTALTLQYTIKNTGAGTIDQKNWFDYIYLSPTSIVNDATLIYVGNTFQSRSLASGQSFTQAASVALPADLLPGRYYVVIKTDFNNQIFESTGEANNTTVASTSTAISFLPAIDLAATTGTILSGSAIAGGTLTVQWTVKNNSSSSTITPYWYDGIYLSTNPILDASDVLLAPVYNDRPLAAGGTYTKTQTIVLPNEASGTLYLLVNVDKDNHNQDDHRENNVLPLNNGQSITVTVPPPADLVPLSLVSPTQGTLSQPINITFTVKNTGTSPTASSYWYDQVILATGTQPQAATDIVLGTFAHTSTLAPGASYVVTEQVFIPSNVLGNYVLLVKTDAYNNVYERNNEENNVAFANIFINPQLPSDLTVSHIDLPLTEQYAGSSATISWQLTNIGANPVNGYLREAVYLSKDAILDAGDILFGTVDKTTYLASQASETRSLEKPLANLAVGEYYVIVKTDILNNIIEQNEANNQTISTGKLIINVRELPLNVLTATTLGQDVTLYYRLVIPEGLAGETLSLTLKGDSLNNAINRLFIRKDSVPTANQYTYVGLAAFKANQQIIIPALQAGTYYLMALGTNTSSASQPITLLANIIPFRISTVDANKGGNTGLVTIKLTGAKFESGMTVTLIGSQTYTATNVYFSDPSKLFATFNLAGAVLGNYTVNVTKAGGVSAQLPNSFTIISGTPGGVDGALQLFTCTIQNIGFDENIDLVIVHPAVARRNAVFKMSVTYTNGGNVDIPAQSRIFLSLSGAPINFSPEFNKSLSELVLELTEKDGPPDILRAGSSGFITIYSKAIVTQPGPLLYTITQ
ncbi:CARDB domain-containing protein [Spirosoma harenae]